MTSNIYSEARFAAVDPIDPPERAMTIGAHPDDAEFGAGGTLAKWAKAGTHSTVLVVSDGSKGTWDPDLRRDDLVAQRIGEQRNAADVLGIADVVMLDHVDGEVEHGRALQEELCYWIRAVRPQVLFTHDPWKHYMLHPDHRAVGMAVIDAVVAARDHLFFPEQLVDGLAKHRPDALLLWSAEQVDHWENISDTFDLKLAALMEHSSQGQTTMGEAHDSAEGRAEFEHRLRTWSADQAQPTPYALAEGFKRLTP